MKISTTLPNDLLAELDQVASRQGLTRAAALREATRWYVGTVRHLPPAEDALPDEAEAIEQAEAEFARGETVRLEDALRRLRR